MSDQQPVVPPYPEGHRLLEGRTVLITAAAGTGIGFATAKRAAEEGARVVISDAHERRLGEAAERIGEISGEPPLAVPCDVTDGEQVQRLFDSAVDQHGGIGFTWEHDLHMWLKRGKALEHAYGSPADHRRSLSSSLFEPEDAGA